MNKKAKRLNYWIEQEKSKVQGHSLHGVVLAPVVSGHSKEMGNIQVVCGMDARNLLGGLGQVFHWMV